MRDQENKNMLYYYCSMKTLDSILESQEIRLYDLLTMNDPSELTLRKVNFLERLFGLYQKSPFKFEYERNGIKGDFASFIWPKATQYFFRRGEMNTTLSFALCMSSLHDSLSQWRMYGDNGKGAFIGFNITKLREFTSHNQEFVLQEVTYVDDFQTLIRETLSKKLEEIKKLYDEGNNNELLKVQESLFDDIYYEAYKYKLQDYETEKETRLVCKIQGNTLLSTATPEMIKNDQLSKAIIDVDFRNEVLRSYLTVKIEDIGFEYIMLGPCNPTPPSNLKILLAKKGFTGNIQVATSEIPYRG